MLTRDGTRQFLGCRRFRPNGNGSALRALNYLGGGAGATKSALATRRPCTVLRLCGTFQ